MSVCCLAKTSPMRFFLAGLLSLLLMPHSAFAGGPWMIDYTKSSLTFTGKMSGKEFTGHFSGYIAKVDFDIRKPENSKIEIQIDMRTAATGDMEKDAALPNAEWFDSKNVPTAEFLSTEVKKITDNDFTASGLFKLKLSTNAILIPFKLEHEDDAYRATGQFTINRKDYGVGTGEWASDQYVAYPVTVSFSLLAHPPVN